MLVAVRVTVSGMVHVELTPVTVCDGVSGAVLVAVNRSTIVVTGPEQVSELCSTTVHCNIAGEPSIVTVLDRVADGAGTRKCLITKVMFVGLSIYSIHSTYFV